MAHKIVTKKHGNAEGLSLKQKAKIIRAHWGAIKEIADDLGFKTHTAVSQTLDGKRSLSSRWVRERILPAIDRKVDELLSAQNRLQQPKERKKRKA